MPPPPCASLTDLAVGAVGTVVEIADSAPDHVALRLRHLGFRAGTEVRALRVAPLGDPTVYRILGYDMCLRRHEARHIRVTVAP